MDNSKPKVTQMALVKLIESQKKSESHIYRKENMGRIYRNGKEMREEQ